MKILKGSVLGLAVAALLVLSVFSSVSVLASASSSGQGGGEPTFLHSYYITAHNKIEAQKFQGTNLSSLPSTNISDVQVIFNTTGKDYSIIAYTMRLNNTYSATTIEYNREFKSGNASITDMLITGSGNTYVSVVIANFIPGKGEPILYGDVFGYNTSSTLAGHYKVMAKALDDIGAKYIHGHNDTLKRLGEDYKMFGGGLDQMANILPHSIQTMNVSATVLEAYDDLLWCIMTILGVSASVAFLILDAYGCIETFGLLCALTFALQLNIMPIFDVLAIVHECE